MKKGLAISGIVVLVFVSMIGFGIFMETRQLPELLAQIQVEDVNLAEVEDGEYLGECNIGKFVGTKVKVTVKDHAIRQVELVEHRNGRGEKAEILPRKIVESQRIRQDVISGATISSKAILKAVESALRAEQLVND